MSQVSQFHPAYQFGCVRAKWAEWTRLTVITEQGRSRHSEDWHYICRVELQFPLSSLPDKCSMETSPSEFITSRFMGEISGAQIEWIMLPLFRNFLNFFPFPHSRFLGRIGKNGAVPNHFGLLRTRKIIYIARERGSWIECQFPFLLQRIAESHWSLIHVSYDSEVLAL